METFLFTPIENPYICRSKKQRNMKSAIILLFVLAFFFGFSATRERSAHMIGPSSGDSIMIWEKLQVHCDPKISELLKLQVEQGKKSGTLSGYRLQIYFGSGEKAHSQATRIKTDFLSSNPGIKAYLLFKSPDFIVRVGDFRTKSEALKLGKSLTYQYPNAFIVADEIAFPELNSNIIIN